MGNLEKTKTHFGKLVNKIEHCIYIPCLLHRIVTF